MCCCYSRSNTKCRLPVNVDAIHELIPNNNSNGYLDRLTRAGPKRLQIR